MRRVVLALMLPLAGCSNTPPTYKHWRGPREKPYFYFESDGRKAFYPGFNADYRPYGYTDAEAARIQQ